jgi:hypothetical protein
MEDVMYKRVLIGLFVLSVVALWGSAAQAFNRINGIIIKHGSIEVEVILCGNPLVDTLLTVDLEVEIEIQCKNPAGKIVPGTPGHQTFSRTFGDFEGVPFGEFTNDDNGGACDNPNDNNQTTHRFFTFEFPSDLKCKQKNWTKVPGSELAKSVEATVKWCTDDNDNDSCQDEERIEFVETACTGSRGEGGVPSEDISCNPVEHVDGLEGIEPPPLTAVAYYDFQQWVVDNSEKGFKNSYPFTDTEDGLTLTAEAFESPYSTASHVYMDGISNGIIGGMGVCSVLNVYKQCTPATDDSVSNEEILRWIFSHNITQVKLELGNGDHFDFASNSFRYQYGSQGWQTATTDGDGKITLNFDGTSNQLEFKVKVYAASESDFFYIRKATVTYTP